jgi:hypothetical protein
MPENNQGIDPENLVEIETRLDILVVPLRKATTAGERLQDKRLS